MPHVNSSSWQRSSDEPRERVRLTLHDADPITGNEDTLYTIFYEEYRGYTIYSTPRGRCCIHSTQGCVKLQGKFVCFYDVEGPDQALSSSSDSVERYVPQEEYVCLNWRKLERKSPLSCPMQHVS